MVEGAINGIKFVSDRVVKHFSGPFYGCLISASLLFVGHLHILSGSSYISVDVSYLIQILYYFI